MKKSTYLNWGLIVSLVAVIGLLSCSSDDDKGSEGNNGECPKSIANQVARGNFKGTNFEVTGGIYIDQSFDGTARFFCSIHVKEVTGGNCSFPTFEGSNDTVLFTLTSLEAQTFDVNDEISTDGVIRPTLNFNRTKGIETEAELSCGRIIINGLNDNDQLTGSVVATGVEGSTINGNFVLDLCVPGF